ncbi:MAG: polysaccharide deacetylase family protein [Oscillospiraceae bacterium]
MGEWVDKYPESVKALADAGNEVMNHSSTHPHMAQLSAEQIQTEVNTCADKIEAVTGTRPTLFRCPYGEYNDTVVSTINGLGMHVIQWDVDSLDWKGLSSDEITSRVLTRVQPGSIVLFHNAAEHTPEALAGIIEALIADGYSIIHDLADDPPRRHEHRPQRPPVPGGRGRGRIGRAGKAGHDPRFRCILRAKAL